MQNVTTGNACAQGACHGAEPCASAPKNAKWTRIATWLVASTMFYNVVEAVVALWSGAKAESVALLGFGLDSVIECAAASVMLWRLSVEARGANREAIEVSERRVRRFIGGTFLALALYIVANAGWNLWTQHVAEESVSGIVLAATSLVIMPLIAVAKLRAAKEIGSRALRAEAKETLVCSYLSFTLLVGLIANAKLAWWWVDSVAAALMVPWLIKEGLEGVRGDDCCD